MKILIIGDIHIGTSSESHHHPGIIRQANSEAVNTLRNFSTNLKPQDYNLVVHTGDSLRDTYDKEKDKKLVAKALDLLNVPQIPSIHLLGNHELQALTMQEIVGVYNSQGLNPQFYGIRELNGFQFVWLDLSLDENNYAHLPEERFEWLRQNLNYELPTIVFTHYSLVPIDPTGSFYFETDPQAMYHTDANKILDILKETNLVLAINAHIHQITHQQQDGVHFITVPSFSENIAAANFPHNNPGVYSVLDVTDSKFVLSSYSGGFAFAKIEGEL